MKIGIALRWIARSFSIVMVAWILVMILFAGMPPLTIRYLAFWLLVFAVLALLSAWRFELLTLA